MPNGRRGDFAADNAAKSSGADAVSSAARPGLSLSTSNHPQAGTTTTTTTPLGAPFSAPVRHPSQQARQVVAPIRKHSLPPPPKAPPPPPPLNAAALHQRVQYPLHTPPSLQSPTMSEFSEQGDFF
ncbi:hypothetical protein KEM55_005802, partial [Ascosphaera atra]